jgi:hypothetical protein
MALLLPQAIGHAAHVDVKHFDAERIAHAIDHHRIDLTLEQALVADRDGSLAAADLITEAQLVLAGVKDEFHMESAYNLIVTTGLTFLSNRLTGGSSGGATNPLSAGYTRIGVGDSTTAASVSQTDLQASTNKLYKQIVSSGYPSISGGAIQWQSIFGSAQGNYAWQEWGIDNGGTGTAGGTANDNSTVATLFNRSVASLGTKASGTTATITVTITES